MSCSDQLKDTHTTHTADYFFIFINLQVMINFKITELNVKKYLLMCIEIKLNKIEKETR